MNIFVSSVAFDQLSIEEVEFIAAKHNLSIEFSANFKPKEDLRDKFKASAIDRLPHNYFPPPADPFVLNLASQNEDILRLSRDHCKQGIELASICRLKYYSAHAGFCLDPSPDSLGKKLIQPDEINRDSYWDTFIESCKYLSDEAAKNDVIFLFENNVLMESNLRADGINPLLCVDSEEILKVFEEVNHASLGFLLDTAHLKVSAASMRFDKKCAVESLKDRIAYIHHSDNDGTRDTNEPLTNEYWFLNYLSQFSHLPHVVEVKNQTVDDLKKQISLLSSTAQKR